MDFPDTDETIFFKMEHEIIEMSSSYSYWTVLRFLLYEIKMCSEGKSMLSPGKSIIHET